MKSALPWAAVLAVSAAAATLCAQSNPHPLPRLVHKDGRYALFVDDAPYLMLGAQVGNSSAWPGVLPKVWPAVAYLHANNDGGVILEGGEGIDNMKANQGCVTAESESRSCLEAAGVLSSPRA